MKRVAIFMGTRPEGIKLAPVIHALQNSKTVDIFVVNTGQHDELMRHVINIFDIEVHRNLNVMRSNQNLAGLTARLINRIDHVLENNEVSLALIQGDTTTILAAALTCFYHHIPLGHVEAGLRTSNIRIPFPEEANRRLASHLIDLHFSPTNRARENLLSEGVPESKIFVTGNTVVDALQMEIERQEDATIKSSIEENLTHLLGEDWDINPYVLITGHRRENFGDGLHQICAAIDRLAIRFPDHLFIYPVHLNPNVKGPVADRLGEIHNVALIPPQPYPEFVHLLNGCRLVLTDSGGVQEEAPGLGKPVLVTRQNTERPEGVEAGVVKLVGTDVENIVEKTTRLLIDSECYQRMSKAKNPYGDGQAAKRIVKAIDGFLDH